MSADERRLRLEHPVDVLNRLLRKPAGTAHAALRERMAVEQVEPDGGQLLEPGLAITGMTSAFM